MTSMFRLLDTVVSLHVSLPAGFRSLRTKPGYVFTCVLVLGVSSAALLTVAAVIDALLTRPPTAQNPQEILFVRGSVYNGQLSHPDFLDLQERNRSFSELFAYDRPRSVGFDAGAHHRDVHCAAVSGTYFPTLGVTAARGRVLTPEDDVVGAEPVIVVSDDLREQFELELGALVEINRRPFRLVGVLAPDHIDLARDHQPDAWIPTAQMSAYHPAWRLTTRNSQWLRFGGRVRPGVTVAEVQAELDVLAERFRREWPDFYSKLGLSVFSFPALRLAQDDRARTMLLLGGTVAALSALAFTNFFALALLRVLSRRREIAVRMALGATRGTISRWLLGELSAVLAMGLGAGGVISGGLFRLLQLDPSIRELFEGASVRLDGRVAFVVAGGAAIALGVIWLALSRQACRDDLAGSIRESAAAPGRHRTFGGLLATQLALALLLLAMSAAFLGALRKVVTQDLPFSTERVALLDADLRTLGWAQEPEQGHQFIHELMVELRRLPGVTAVGGATALPLQNSGGTHAIPDTAVGGENPDNATAFSFVSPDFFASLGVSFLQGRTLSEAEVQRALDVAVINRAMAERFWPQEPSVIGRTFQPWANGPRTAVVGVVNDVPMATGTPAPHFYLPFTDRGMGAFHLAVRLRDDSAGLRERIAARVASLWPNANPPKPYPMIQVVRDGRKDLVTSTRVVFWVAVFATAITALGLYSFSAFTAAQTIRDSAVRMALGAGLLRIAGAHLLRYRWGLAAGFGGGLALVLASGPLLGKLDVSLQPPNMGAVIVAAGILVFIGVIGLCLPLTRLRRLDLSKMLTRD